MKNVSLLLVSCVLCALLGFCFAWQRKPAVPAPPWTVAASVTQEQPAALPPPATPDADLKEARVNEVGRVPILEYHEIGPNPPNAGFATREMHRSVEEFRADLQRLYAEGYCPITLREYLDNRIDLPLGKSPVILTFDDARSTQFQYLSDGTIKPDCAIGILQEFAQEHPDFPVRAVFYVLPEGAFGSEKYAAKKLRALLAMGCELGNHTLNHHYFNRMSDAAIAKEIALGKAVTERMVPGAHLDTLALPGGCKPRSKNYGVLTSGAYNGIHYENRAVVDAWGGSAPAPVSHKYDRLRIPRVLGVGGSEGVNASLDYLHAHPDERYVSDGDPDTVSIPKRLAKWVDHAKLQNAPLRLYEDGSRAPKPETTSTKRAVTRRKSRHRRRHSSNQAPRPLVPQPL